MAQPPAHFWLLGLAAVLCAVPAALVWTVTNASVESAGIQSLSLHRGDNFVGWVAEPTAVADPFEQVPEAVLIYRWDADSLTYRHAINARGRALRNLRTIEPGMAVMIRTGGTESVQWERSLIPAKGMVTLYSGENWVAWNCHDEWPLEQVAHGIGTSLESIEVRGQV